MGSFPAKIKNSYKTDRRPGTFNEVDGATKEDEKTNEILQNANPQPEEPTAVSTNEHRSKIQEQHTVLKVRQSFSWLASIKKEEYRKSGRKPIKATSRNVVKYRNEKYVLAWQNCTEWPKGKEDGGSHSSSKVKKQGKCKKKTEEEKFKPVTSSSKK